MPHRRLLSPDELNELIRACWRRKIVFGVIVFGIIIAVILGVL